MSRNVALTIVLSSVFVAGGVVAQTSPEDAGTTESPAGTAQGQTYVGRDLTATAGAFDFLLGPVPRPMLDDGGLRFDTGGDNLHLDAGLAYGITDDFEVGGYLLKLRLFQDGDIESPEIWGTYQFVRGSVDIGMRVSIPLPIFGGDFYVALDVPIVFRLGDNVRLETGVGTAIAFSEPVLAGAFVPVRPVVNVTPQIYLGLDTGLAIPFDGGVVSVPLGVFGGYSITPNIDIGLVLRFDRLWANDDNGVGPASIGLGVNLYEFL